MNIMSETVMKQGDTAPPLRATLFDGGVPVPLSTALAIRLVMVDEDTDLEVLDDDTLTGDDAGLVTYSWAPGVTDIVRRLRVEFTVTWLDGSKQTFPAGAGAYVQIKPSLNMIPEPVGP